MSFPLQKQYSNQFANAKPGEIQRAGSATADITTTQTTTIVAGYAFRFDDIEDLFLVGVNTGADGTDPLSAALNVTIDGVSVFTTQPDLTDSAVDGATTLAAGTGIIVGVIDTANNAGAVGAVVAIVVTVTRTTPEDEMVVQAIVKLTAQADYDSDIAVETLAS